jgi:anti-sigma factor RsiW
VNASACHTCRELIGGYVLDALEPAERDLVHSHLASCEICAREHAELATIPALLDAADSADAVPLRPPPRLEEAVLDRFARERRGASADVPPTPEPARDAPPSRRAGLPQWLRRRWLAPALAATACALAIALVAAFALDGSGDDGYGGPSGPAAPGVAAQQGHVYSVAMSGTGTVPQAGGEARLYPGETGTGVHLQVNGLRPDAYDYELWCVRDDGWKISAGTFRVDASGRADVHLTAAANPRDYDGLSIQARPWRGSTPARPMRVMSGRIRS